jgi:hypothetical protein
MSIHTPVMFSFWRPVAILNVILAKVMTNYCLFRRWIT